MIFGIRKYCQRTGRGTNDLPDEWFFFGGATCHNSSTAEFHVESVARNLGSMPLSTTNGGHSRHGGRRFRRLGRLGRPFVRRHLRLSLSFFLSFSLSLSLSLSFESQNANLPSLISRTFFAVFRFFDEKEEREKVRMP